MFDSMYLRLVYMYESNQRCLNRKPLHIRFCVWVLLTFFQNRLRIDKLLKELAYQKQEYKLLECKRQKLQALYLRTRGDLSEDEMLANPVEEGDLAWLEEEYPRCKRGGV